MQDVNRLKIVLVEKKTVSGWQKKIFSTRYRDLGKNIKTS